MNAGTVIDALETIAPLTAAESWDNVGLLIGTRDRPVERVMLTIDLTRPVLHEAIDAGAQMIVAYHPPIFKALTTITDRVERERIVLEAIEAGIVVHSPHTALDAAPGGVNDWLAAACGTGDVRALVSHEAAPEGETHKVVTFCPRESADAIRDALAAIGAGRIGDYQRCSFEIPGTGTFMGGAGTQPVVGRSGRLERIDEVRLEMVCSTSSLPLAVRTLQEFHPYEEPPIEIYALRPRPLRSTGAGRRLVLDRKSGLKPLLERIKKHLGVKHLQVAAGRDGPRSIGVIGVCAGAGGSLLETAIGQGCELFLTGEMRHHDVLAAQAAGCTIVLAGHTNTERGYLKRLRTTLRTHVPDAEIAISRRDADPLRVA